MERNVLKLLILILKLGFGEKIVFYILFIFICIFSIIFIFYSFLSLYFNLFDCDLLSIICRSRFLSEQFHSNIIFCSIKKIQKTYLLFRKKRSNVININFKVEFGAKIIFYLYILLLLYSSLPLYFKLFDCDLLFTFRSSFLFV